MQCYTELLAPTGVTHALALPFLNDRSNNLVVVKTSLLQIFSVQSNSSGLQRVETQPNEQTTKLVLEREYPLAGTVTDLCRVKVLNTRSGGEAILISFRNAKLSLIEWDPERRGISTISIHYYERDDLTRSPWVSDLSNCDSILSLDPSSRCAIFNFGVRNLAIIPFHQPGDDLVMGDYDPDIEGHRAESYNLGDVADREKAQQGLIYETPYAPSFVLPLSALDPSILHPINFAFLYEYREPTFGILYSQVATSSALMQERKDIVFYSVFTLDLEQRASTTLLSVSRLPSDLFKVVALPPPVGGALLIGSNELVHVDQAGKTNAVGVNEFSRMVSAFSMTDQSDLALRLENCVVEILDDGSGDLLMVLSTGDFAIVRFRLDGRSVSGISVHLLSTHPGVVSMNSAASSSAYIGEGKVFLGSESSDSVLLGCSFTSSSSRKPRPQSRLAMDDSVDTDEDQSDNEDDLYATSPDLALAVGPLNIEPSSGLRYFHVHDKLINIAPVRDIALGRRSVVTIAKGSRLERDSAELELVAAQGSDSSGGLVVLRRELDPDVLQSFSVESADCLWTASVVHGTQAVSNGSDDNRSQSRCFVIISRRRGIEKEESLVYLEDAGELKAFKAPEFNPNEDTTIDIGTMMGDKRVVQVLKNEVRIYDSDLGLTQIYPIWDDDTNDERVAVNTSFADPCLAILRDDSSILFLQVDDSGDLDEVILNDQLAAKNWVSCSLYYDKTGTFSSVDSASKGLLQGGLYLFLLGQDSRLYIYRFPDQNLVTIIEGLTGQPPILSSEPLRRAGVRESLAEAIVADLGDSASASPYLILRSQNDDINIYKPFVASAGAGTGTSSLRFSKEANTVVPRLPSRVGSELSDTRRYEGQSLRILANLSGLATVFVPGASAGFIVRTSTSLPHFIRLRGSHPRSVSTLNPLSANSSFVFLESNDTINLCKLPAGMLFDHEWPLQKVPLGEQVDHLTYSSSSGTYVLGTCQRATFKLPEDDELHPEWRNEVVSFLPEVHRSSLKIVSPKTWSIIDCHSLDASEYVMAMKNMSLEVSENTHERREMIVVGTAIARGEDIPSRGCIYVFEVIKVVPDPENPAIDRRLKLIGKEVVKGAVTALSEIGGQGFIIVSQGQKCMVRGLKEDGSLLPVAFMDMQCYVSVVKELKGTGMCILGDATKGLWFAGYSEEPYKLSLFAKDLDYLEVVAADFLPDGKRLFIVVADSDCNIHILQYDPEADPKSSNGDRLLSRSKFHTGNMASTLTLLPRTSVSSGLLLAQSDDMDLDHQVSLYQALVTSQNGSIGLITCITEEVYRRLSALQSQLTNTLEHPCGLNPRAFRAVESDGTAGRGMLDGNLLFQWLGLSKQRKTEIASRVGANEWEIKADLQSIGGDGLGYL
ncbi:cleavage/polyadenylation factor CFT1 [Aspergillus homomorphus CBS 101889]|uniref:Protein CFT1 n=1 Tax=Aspergillus homomorphus (strain CBS 101889) TaxID=1450537 RepID=A0A395HIY0_ASPHC|nr:cleavage and polyadenylation specificity factor subunit A [Aspergillus homomorphus CBS 101889]RAL07489.1 cleavage and polyadenylation specificity factor subunit A [Aspergillus homomorphus CBS 101889]